MISILFHNVNAQSANNSIIKSMPKHTQGYLVLSNTNYSEVNNWRVYIYSQTEDNTTLVETLILPEEKNYVRIPNSYLNSENLSPQYYFIAKGFNQNNSLIVETSFISVLGDWDLSEPEACNGCAPRYGIICEDKCNGIDFAWEIVQYAADTAFSSSYYHVQQAFDYFDNTSQQAIPYYEYMDYNTFIARCNSGSFSSARANDECDLGVNQFPFITDYLDGNTHSFYDINGTRIFGQVIGVEKGLGYWDAPYGNGGSIFTDVLQDGLSTCSLFYQSQRIDRINAYSNISSNGYQDLYCSPSFNSGGTISADPIFGDCLGLYSNSNSNFIVNFTNWISNIDNCLIESGFTGPFLDTNSLITIQDISRDNINPIQASIRDVIDGVFEFEVGLYAVGLVTNNDIYIPIVFEANASTQQNNNNIRSQFTNIFPNPTNGQFTIEYSSDKDCSFKSEIINSMGQVLYVENYIIRKGEKIFKSVNLELPTGVYFNKITYSNNDIETTKFYIN